MEPLIKNLWGVIFQLIGLVNAFWAAYATVTVALLGWMFSTKRPWSWQQKLVVSVAYVLIVFINCVAHYRANVLMRALAGELHAAILAKNAFTEDTRGALLSVFPPSPWVLVSIHALVDSAVIVLIWMHDRFTVKGDSLELSNNPLITSRGNA